MPYKVKRQPWYRRRFLLPAILFIAIVGGVVAFVLIHNHNRQTQTATVTTGIRPQNTVNYSPATSADNNPNEQRKSSSSPSNTLNSGTSSSSGGTSTITAKIVSKNPTGNNTVHVGTLVTGTNIGSCTLKASQSGQQDVVINSSVQQDVNNYDCGPMNLQLPSGGTWNLSLKVVNGSQQATDSTTVTL